MKALGDCRYKRHVQFRYGHPYFRPLEALKRKMRLLYVSEETLIEKRSLNRGLTIRILHMSRLQFMTSTRCDVCMEVDSWFRISDERVYCIFLDPMKHLSPSKGHLFLLPFSILLIVAAFVSLTRSRNDRFGNMCKMETNKGPPMGSHQSTREKGVLKRKLLKQQLCFHLIH